MSNGFYCCYEPVLDDLTFLDRSSPVCVGGSRLVAACSSLWLVVSLVWLLLLPILLLVAAYSLTHVVFCLLLVSLVFAG